MKLATFLLSGYVAMTLPSITQAQEAFRAELVEHAFMPAQTYIAAPKDAPANLQSSGKFTTGKRIEKLGSVEGTSFDRPSGVFLPFKGQPIQGHSGIKRMQIGRAHV